MFVVTCLNGVHTGDTYEVRGSLVAGRQHDCEIVLEDMNASRRHAALEYDGSQLVLRDLGSSNGTSVNGERVRERVLTHGDVVRMGDTRLRVRRRESVERGSSSGPVTEVFSIDASETGSAPLARLPLQGAAPEPTGPAAEAERRLDVAMAVAESLATVHDLDEVLGRALDSLLEAFPQAERGFLLLGERQEELRPRAVRLRVQGPGPAALEVSTTLCRAALDRREVLVFRAGRHDEFADAMSLVRLHIRTALVVPLIVRDETLGLIVVDSTRGQHPFEDRDMRLGAALGRQIAIALKNAALVKQTEREAKTKQNLLRFLPYAVVEQALRGDVSITLGGSQLACTALFADVVGFTRMAEGMDPGGVVSMMNALFERVVPPIESEDGAIDKFIGDCIMALWGVPFGTDDHAQRAMRAGLAMQNALWLLNHERAQAGVHALGLGVGLESGAVVAGNIGSPNRMEYTVIGDTVNTAMRIESHAAAGQVLAGATAWTEVAAVAHGVRLPPLLVKNKARPVEAVSVRGVADEAGEVRLHVPARVGDAEVLLTRRLEDESFVALYPAERSDLGGVLKATLHEHHGLTGGRVLDVQGIGPHPTTEGVTRSRLKLEDPTLGGLLGATALETPLAWAEMPRSAP